MPASRQKASARSHTSATRRVLAAHGLDDLARRPPDGEPHSLRFVLVHVLEETARHVGHLDVLREALDGTTGSERSLELHGPSVVAQISEPA